MTTGHSFIRRQPQISLFSLFFDGKLFRALCAFVLCANRTDPKNLSRREREGERNPCRFRSSPYCGMGGMTSNGCPAYRVAKPQQLFGYFSCRVRPITFFFPFSFAVFFHRMVFVWSQSPSAPFMDVTSIIHNPCTAAGHTRNSKKIK